MWRSKVKLNPHTSYVKISPYPSKSKSPLPLVYFIAKSELVDENATFGISCVFAPLGQSMLGRHSFRQMRTTYYHYCNRQAGLIFRRYTAFFINFRRQLAIIHCNCTTNSFNICPSPRKIVMCKFFFHTNSSIRKSKDFFIQTIPLTTRIYFHDF